MDVQKRRDRVGLVLVGGGARGAYQAGALQGIGEILRPALGESRSNEPFFKVITGISAGSINAAFLGCQSGPFPETLERLAQLWFHLKMQDVIRTDTASISQIGLRWLRDLIFGGLMAQRRKRSNHLLDTAPLKRLLEREADFENLKTNILSGRLYGFGVSATNYLTGTAVTFYEGVPEIQNWARSSRLGIRTRLSPSHVLASASIPVLFEPVAVEGAYYGDGGIRMNTPLSPAIHLGSDRVVAISIRHPRSIEKTVELNRLGGGLPISEISVADIAGVMMNAAFLDGLDSDVERTLRINQTLKLLEEAKATSAGTSLKQVPLLVLSPSTDLGAMAQQQFKKFPRTMRYMLKGLGVSDTTGSDLMSYLSFDPSFTRPLLELGRADALLKREEILDFFKNA